jgi:hypothetical protein
MKMKLRAVIAALTLGISYPILADDTSPEKSQQHYVPRLSDIMVATQLRHFKLWYASQVRNWDLASYELAQIRGSFDNAMELFRKTPGADTTKMTQSLEETGNAIAAKDNAKFVKAYDGLTSACNGCHQAAGFGFIVIREPRMSPIQTSPFSNESFRPK